MAEKNSKDDKRPIIKKVKKVAGHGHHGGAWKVAYADFVTAMMAFFLLLWLLSTSSKATLEGLAEFFTPTEGIKDSQGIGFKGGLAESEDGALRANLSNPGLVAGHSMQGQVPDDPNLPKIDAEQEANILKKGANEVEKKFSQDASLQEYKDNVNVRQTSEGLQIDIMDSDKYGIFERGSSRLTLQGRTIVEAMVPILRKMPNFISVAGHTDASPTEAGQASYTNWELSADRAQAVRRFLVSAGMERERTKKVIGFADRDLYVPKEPRSPKNRRIALTLLKGSHLLIPDVALSKEEAAAPAPAMPTTSTPEAEPTAEAAPAPEAGVHPEATGHEDAPAASPAAATAAPAVEAPNKEAPAAPAPAEAAHPEAAHPEASPATTEAPAAASAH